MSANRPNNSKAAAPGNVCREQRCVDGGSRVKHGRFGEDGSKMGILMLPESRSGITEAFPVHIITHAFERKSGWGGGVGRKLPTQQLSDH